MRCLQDKESNFSLIVETAYLKEAREQLNTWIVIDLGRIIKKRDTFGE